MLAARSLGEGVAHAVLERAGRARDRAREHEDDPPGAVEDDRRRQRRGLQARGEGRLDPRGALAAAMGVPGLPVTVILNPEGQEVARLIGDAEWDSDSAKAVLGALVAGQ